MGRTRSRGSVCGSGQPLAEPALVLESTGSIPIVYPHRGDSKTRNEQGGDSDRPTKLADSVRMYVRSSATSTFWRTTCLSRILCGCWSTARPTRAAGRSSSTLFAAITFHGWRSSPMRELLGAAMRPFNSLPQLLVRGNRHQLKRL